MASTAASGSDMDAHKAAVRAHIWAQLREVAVPDSRFHLDFSSFIADFAGSSAATERVRQLAEYGRARTVFIAPDNCLEELRRAALADGKRVVVTTYGIRRGFWVLEPGSMGQGSGRLEYAATLDGMERVGRPVSLGRMRSERWTVELLVTGTGAVQGSTGVRFGKGHGFFDLEWAMLYSIGAVGPGTPAVGVVHDCQVVDEGVALRPDVFDTACDVVVTPTRTLRVAGAEKPRVGVVWDRLRPGMVEAMPPLQELREMLEAGGGRVVG